MLSEDAIAGVEAGKAGKFGLVLGVNRADDRYHLGCVHKTNSIRDELAKYAHIVVDDFKDITEKQLDEWYTRTSLCTKLTLLIGSVSDKQQPSRHT